MEIYFPDSPIRKNRTRERNAAVAAATRHRSERPLIPTPAGFPREIGRETKESCGVSKRDRNRWLLVSEKRTVDGWSWQSPLSTRINETSNGVTLRKCVVQRTGSIQGLLIWGNSILFDVLLVCSKADALCANELKLPCNKETWVASKNCAIRCSLKEYWRDAAEN